MRGRAFVGTSGWVYKHWRGAVFEKGLAQKSWLKRIAEVFDTVEVNTSFYRIPQPETVEAWVNQTPDGFLFALKLWRGITHYRKLVNAGDLTERFLRSAEKVPSHRRAPVLIQLPPNQKPNPGKLEKYIAEFRTLSNNGWRIAVEFRDDAWYTRSTYELLDRLDVSLCVHDMQGKGANDLSNEATFVYVRRHGSSEQSYAGSYSPAAIRRDTGKIRSWLDQDRDVFVYYNNDIGGHAYRNALELRAALRR